MDQLFIYTASKQRTEINTSREGVGNLKASNQTWSKHILDHCARADKRLGHVKRCSEEISNVRARRTLYLSLVRSVFGYSSQVWSPQTVILMQRVELAYLCNETYQEQINSLHLLPLSYWHEYLDILFFFKEVNGLIDMSNDVLPNAIPQTKTTRPSSGNQTSFRPSAKPQPTSFFIHTARTRKRLPTALRSPDITIREFKTVLHRHYLTALRECYSEEDPRTRKTICLKCNTSWCLRPNLTCCF